MLRNIGKVVIFITAMVVLGGSYSPASASGAFKNTQANWDKKAEEFKAAKAAQ